MEAYKKHIEQTMEPKLTNQVVVAICSYIIKLSYSENAYFLGVLDGLKTEKNTDDYNRKIET